MENNESLQLPVISDVEMVNANAKKNTEETPNEPTGQRGFGAKRHFCYLGGTIEQICMTVMAIGLIVVMLTGVVWARFLVAGICVLAFLVPVTVRVIRSRKGINPEKICGILRKQGYSPVVMGDEIRWTSNGKESILRIRSYCQVEIAREYDIPSIPAAIEGNEKAALETMKEVYLAKVTVHENNGTKRLAFSTEPLCASTKEFSAYLPMCLEILDLAEVRQREHIMRIRNEKEEKRSHKIGFIHSDGSIR